MSFNYKVIGKRIQQYRRENGKTQEELAEIADISKNYLSKLELGKAAGSLDKYYNIAQALNVTVDMLIGNNSTFAATDDQLFLNRLSPLISSLSVNQRKMLIDFIDLLNNYKVTKSNITKL